MGSGLTVVIAPELLIAHDFGEVRQRYTERDAILYGLGVFGTVAAALCRASGRNPLALQRLGCRFSGIVIPGDKLDLQIWEVGEGYAFTATVNGGRALDQGILELRADS